MTSYYLFPSWTKYIGWVLFVIAAIGGVLTLVNDWEPSFLTAKVPAFFIDRLFEKKRTFGWVENNMLNEILGTLTMAGLLLIAFAKEKIEDEFITRIRLDALLWAVYVNYAVLFVSFWLFYDFTFFWVMVINMYTILIIFILRFNLLLFKNSKYQTNEE